MAESASAIQKRVKDQRAAEGKAARPVHRFTIPERMANGIMSVGLVQLTSNEELRATKRSRNDTHRLAYELAQQSLVEVNGESVKEGDGTRDSAWAKMEPKVRTLVLTAFGSLHTPEEDDISDFLKSQEVTVG